MEKEKQNVQQSLQKSEELLTQSEAEKILV